MGNPIEKLSTAPSMPQTKEYLVPQATTVGIGRKVEWVRQSSFIRDGIQLNSGKMRATLDLVEKRVLEEEPISIDELQAHETHLTELEKRVISHIRAGGAGRWFKNTKINNVSKKFDAIFGKLHEKKCQVLQNAKRGEVIEACSLFSSEDVNLVDSMGKTALHYAVEKGNLNAVQILLQKGANAGVQDGQGNSPIFFAVDGSKPIFDALLNTMTLDQLKKKNKKGETVFLRGVQTFSEDRCRAIIDKVGSAALQSVDKKGNTPWHYLAIGMSGLQGEAVHRWLTLFSTKPETVKQVWSQKNAEGCTAVQMAAKHQNLAFLSEVFSPFRTEQKTHERTPQTNDMQGSKNPLPFLIDHFNKSIDDEEGKRIGLMIYFLAATHPELFQGKEGARLRTSIAEMGERGISLPPEILYCSEHPYEVQKLVEEKKSEIQGELKKLGDEIASIPNYSKEEKDQALNRTSLKSHGKASVPPYATSQVDWLWGVA